MVLPKREYRVITPEELEVIADASSLFVAETNPSQMVAHITRIAELSMTDGIEEHLAMLERKSRDEVLCASVQEGAISIGAQATVHMFAQSHDSRPVARYIGTLRPKFGSTPQASAKLHFTGELDGFLQAREYDEAGGLLAIGQGLRIAPNKAGFALLKASYHAVDLGKRLRSSPR